MKKVLQLAIILLFSMRVNAQQDLQFSQYMFDHVIVNPGYAGSLEYTQSTLIHRSQWVGWKGAPETNSLTLHGPIDQKNIGVGFNLSNDRIGVTNRTDLNLIFAYHLKLNEKLKLGLGMQGGASYYAYKNSDLVYWDQTDKVYSDGNQTNLLPNFGTGAFLYSDKYYIGISCPHVLDYNTGDEFSINNKNKNMPRETKHYFAEAGYVFNLNSEIAIKPSVLMKYVNNSPAEADINANVFFRQTFGLGVSYRTNDAVVALAELQLSKRIRIGYSYDFTTTEISNYSSGSHEIMIGYDMGIRLLKIKSPRYF